jgi:hypothetical protein
MELNSAIPLNPVGTAQAFKFRLLAQILLYLPIIGPSDDDLHRTKWLAQVGGGRCWADLPPTENTGVFSAV